MNVQTGVGEKEKVLGAAGRDRGGRHGKQASNKHVTAVLTTNEAGDILPIQLVVEGRLELKRWYEPLPQSVVKNTTGLRYLTEPNWFPSDATVSMTAKGSID